MEVKFDVVKPNLHVIPGIEVYRILFSLDGSEVIPVCRDIDRIVAEYIGDLKVKKGGLEVAETGKSEIPGTYEVPFKKFLDVLETSENPDFTITTAPAKLFGLSYIVDAQTIEDYKGIRLWKNLQKDLSEPDDAFDREERRFEFEFAKLDREKTLEEMKKLYQKLDQKVPENYAEIYVTDGLTLSSYEDKKVGSIVVRQLKAKDRTNIENCKSGLIERLKEVDGPCLSFDASGLIVQSLKLEVDAQKLVNNYGDILTNPNRWRERLFRLDP